MQEFLLYHSYIEETQIQNQNKHPFLYLIRIKNKIKKFTLFKCL